MVAMILEAQHKTAEAQKVYEQILADTPRAALAANNLAWLYADGGGNLDVALQLAQVAHEQMPDVAEVNDTLGWIYYKKDLPTLAIGPLESSVKEAPHNAMARYHLGLAYAKAGDKVKAKAAFDEVLKQKPDFHEAEDAARALRTKG